MKTEVLPFNFKAEEPPVQLSPAQSAPSTEGFAFSADPAVAALQVRYQNRQREAQRHMTATRNATASAKTPIISPAHNTVAERELRQKLSSDQLRASKTFAAFREYVEEYMIWLAVDESDPEDVAAYNKFMAANSPATTHNLSDESVEFLFRHIDPKPQCIDEDSD